MSAIISAFNSVGSFLSVLWSTEENRVQEKRKSLLEDNRGAVMLIGLFMATFLIGSMWFMKGLGDAMVFKDRMQEGADHAVFSASAVNARGMNLIAVINIIMYVLVIIHCVIAVLKWAAIACSASVVLCEVCCPAAEALEQAENLYDDTVIDIGLPALSIAGTAAAIGYPWYGSYAGFNVGSDYNATVVAAGPSNIPGFSFSLPLGKLFGSGKAPAGGNLNQGGLLSQSGSAARKGNSASFSSDLKLGLPVILSKNSGLCSRAVNSVANLVPGFLRWLIRFIGGLVTDCSGGVWDQKMFGWKQMYGAAANGNDWMQTWSFNFPHNYDEGSSEAKVALGAGPKAGVPLAAGLQGQAPSPPMYFAQSEMYFDCEKEWSADSCSAKDNAVFNMRWRARMRRVASPDFFGMIMGVIGQNLIGPLIDFGADALKNQIKGTKLARDASAALGKAAKGIAGTAAGQQATKAIGGLLSADELKFHNSVKNAVNNAIGSPNGTPDPGVLH
jgi:hypothetical protein